jgi:alanine dehydrogenase
MKGINTLNGYVTYKAVAEAHKLDYSDTGTQLVQQ